MSILKGTKLGNFAFDQVTDLDMVVKLSAVKALGIDLTKMLLGSALETL
ncbi:hypothetical protein QTH90_30855 [Variovorax sp. J2P1-59]|nr:hypothetical protein [Variovorax sp. J2P1-59]MDM0078842.1 hypothetical protein [Variovorax sp. J2P1-59]